MAELHTASTGGHKKNAGATNSHKLSTRIDLTPMVDLGFLLITFFMYTTTMAKPRTMEINMPYVDNTDIAPTKIPESVALTIILGNKHQVYYYSGSGDAEGNPIVMTTDFNPGKGIRAAILAKKKMIADLQKTGLLSPKNQLSILIKPDTTSTYEDLVAILDEMSINDVRTYAIVDITPVDQKLSYTAMQRNILK